MIRICAECYAINWALQLRPPRPTSPVPESVHGRIRRRLILGGLLNEHETAA
jgi:hypothetical protein